MTRNPQDVTPCHHTLPQSKAVGARFESIAAPGVAGLGGELVGFPDQVNEFEHPGSLWPLVRRAPLATR